MHTDSSITPTDKDRHYVTVECTTFDQSAMQSVPSYVSMCAERCLIELKPHLRGYCVD